MKRYRVGLAVMFALALVVSSLFIQTQKVDAANLTYDSTNPYTTGCAYKNAFVYETQYFSGGYLQLWGSAYCHTAWARVYLYNAAPWNGYADAFIQRSDGKELHCDDIGGNDTVDYGQHSCHTPQLWDRNPYKSWAGTDGGIIPYYKTDWH
ncbi:DUF2690 domain-containing protein [Shimazuella kribbensis]|uniref:DUF2690 domain-containing protein n=1 Tax=Shimazuella kribbensis TaxID=139808 RepID=UPI00040F6F4A|nr:DUF2690 domain-containing protein [Shimazuella kribbensis]